MPASPGRLPSSKALSSPPIRPKWAEILCIEEERVVARDNTATFGRLKLQLPPIPRRHHFVKATVKIRQSYGGNWVMTV